MSKSPGAADSGAGVHAGSSKSRGLSNPSPSSPTNRDSALLGSGDQGHDSEHLAQGLASVQEMLPMVGVASWACDLCSHTDPCPEGPHLV